MGASIEFTSFVRGQRMTLMLLFYWRQESSLWREGWKVGYLMHITMRQLPGTVIGIGRDMGLVIMLQARCLPEWQQMPSQRH